MTSQTTTRSVPPALARNKRRTEVLSKTALLAQAAADMAIVREKKRQIADAFYEMGDAFTRLRRPEVLKALGLTLSALCAKLGVSLSTATRLIEVVSHLKRQDALRWGEEKSRAVLDVARALAPNDPVFAVDKKSIAKALPKGTSIESVTALELAKLAETMRHAHQKHGASRGRGRTTTPGERARGNALERAAHLAGFHEVKVETRATRPGQAAQFVVRGVPADQATRVFTALAKAAK